MTSTPHTTPTPPCATAWDLQNFRTGDVFFASPDQQQRARWSDQHMACHAPVSTELIAQLFAQAKERQWERPVLFGLIPFDATRNASLTMTSRPQSSPAAHGNAVTTAQQKRPQIVDRQPVPAPETYGDMVREALKVFAQGDVKKIVLSRAMDVHLNAPLSYEPVLLDLLRRNAHGYTFALPIWAANNTDTPSGVMLGASPELLVRREGRKVFINPLAGSIGRHADAEVDRQRREGLAISEKDLREHSYVVNDIVRVLREHCSALDVPDGPSVIGTDALWHLSTYLTGELNDAAMTALDLAQALHPTPAICGYPTAKAFEQIQKLEPFDREYFAGLVGWQKPDGDGEWALTLRCARYDGNQTLRLYAGAGTVAGSDPDSEIRETATKMETFMRALT